MPFLLSALYLRLFLIDLPAMVHLLVKGRRMISTDYDATSHAGIRLADGPGDEMRRLRSRRHRPCRMRRSVRAGLAQRELLEPDRGRRGALLGARRSA